MKSSKFVRSKLANRLNASHSCKEVKNNRYHYTFEFREDIGWDWVNTQVGKSEEGLGMELELWKIHPLNAPGFRIEIREVQRRENIDESQAGLNQF